MFVFNSMVNGTLCVCFIDLLTYLIDDDNATHKYGLFIFTKAKTTSHG